VTINSFSRAQLC